jgi:hypothetical protein
MQTNVEYQVSIYPSRFFGYQSKKQTNGIVKSFIGNIWREAKEGINDLKLKLDLPILDDESNDVFEWFLDNLNYIIILERICLERSFQHIRMKERCKPCKMERYAKYIHKYTTDFYIHKYISSANIEYYQSKMKGGETSYE